MAGVRKRRKNAGVAPKDAVLALLSVIERRSSRDEARLAEVRRLREAVAGGK